MNKKINFRSLFTALDEEMELKLSNKIDQIYHPTAKGDESELNWIGLLREYLPERYRIDSGFVIDHNGNISDQIDIIIYDRHYTPLIFKGEKVIYIPIEGVYAIFEVKQNCNKRNCMYAVNKLKSVKNLDPKPTEFKQVNGLSKTEPFEILGGLLTKIGSKKIFDDITTTSELTFVVILNYGVKIKTINKHDFEIEKDLKLAFYLLKLTHRLRLLGTVSAMDTDIYFEQSKK